MRLSPPAGFVGTFSSDDLARDVYSETAGVLRIRPKAVACPQTVADVQRLCAWASQNGIALVPRGSGSSMAGGAVGEGVIVDLHALKSRLTIDRAWNRAAVSSAVTCAALVHAAQAEQLTFPVQPSSAAFATLGGMVATNAAGPQSFFYGSMRPWVHALECVFADGTRATIRRGELRHESPSLERWRLVAPQLRERAAAIPPRRVRKDSSGYALDAFAESGDLVDLLVGSEGTLAFFTEITLDLCPVPNVTTTVVASFRSVEALARATALAREARATTCEFLDATFLQIAQRNGDDGAEGVLLLDIEDESTEAARARAQALASALTRAGATSVRLGTDEHEREELWSLRHAASPILARLDKHVRSMQIVEDCCVPPNHFARYLRGVRDALSDAGLPGVIFGHAGDAHVHVNALVDMRDADWKMRIQHLFHTVTGLIGNLGGTLSGEHGDGRLRSLASEELSLPGAKEIFRTIKNTFDPAGVLNPGVKVPSSELSPFDKIKYDPSLAPLHPTAAAILEAIERERNYSASRLEMVSRTG